MANLAKLSFAKINVAEFVSSSTPATKTIEDTVVNNLFISAKKVSFSTETGSTLDRILASDESIEDFNLKLVFQFGENHLFR